MILGVPSNVFHSPCTVCDSHPLHVNNAHKHVSFSTVPENTTPAPCHDTSAILRRLALCVAQPQIECRCPATDEMRSLSLIWEADDWAKRRHRDSALPEASRCTDRNFIGQTRKTAKHGTLGFARWAGR